METLNLHRSRAHRRIIFDEFFFLELGLALKKRERVEEGEFLSNRSLLVKQFLELLPSH